LAENGKFIFPQVPGFCISEWWGWGNFFSQERLRNGFSRIGKGFSSRRLEDGGVSRQDAKSQWNWVTGEASSGEFQVI